MAREFARTVTGFEWCCVALASGFALLTYGHWVLSDTRVFGLFTALCMFAIAIVFYQTKASAYMHRESSKASQRFNQVSAFRHINQLSNELAKLEEEYRTDITRLERNWL